MLVLSPGQIKAADAYTIENEPISSINLMERACRAFVAEFVKIHMPDSPVYIFCGTGNNGGDGLGIARVLYERGQKVKVFVAGNEEHGSPNFKINRKRLENMMPVEPLTEHVVSALPPKATIIDGLFGSGLSRPLEGEIARLVQLTNDCPAQKVSVDIPSGLFCDKPQGNHPAITAHYTITFQTPKLAFFMPENYPIVGEWRVVDIGLSKGFLQSIKPQYYYQQVGEPDLLLPARHKFMHKGLAGRVLLIGGSKGKTGAVILAAKACMRAGAGLLTVHTSSAGVVPLQTAIPEAMVSEDADPSQVSHIPGIVLTDFQAVAVGPGLGTSAPTANALDRLLSQKLPNLVLDADALNIMSQNEAMLAKLPADSIVTPHLGEFRRLAGNWANDFEKLEKQIGFAVRHKCTVVLKGAYTSIATPEGIVYFNSTGNPGMATAGSGDVLTGIVVALIAQGFSPSKSARMAVLLHGLSGDLAASQTGEYSLMASDLIDFLPQAFRKCSALA